jgi:type I restriction enzyme S subunit
MITETKNSLNYDSSDLHDEHDSIKSRQSHNHKNQGADKWEIPSDWEIVDLGEIAKIKHGRDQKQIEVENGIYPILATGGEIGRTNTPLYSKPSVLIGRKGTIDKPKYMDTPFWTVDTLFYTEISEQVFPLWLYFKFETINWYLYNEVSGVPSLSGSTISKLKIPLPPLPEQKAIAQVLSTADAAIHTTSTLIAQKELRKKWLMQQLLTGKKRLKGFENTKWKIQPLENFIKPIVREIPKPSTSYLGIGLRSHGKGTFLKHDEQPEKNSMDNFYVVRPNDLIVNITFAWEQAIAIVRPEDDGALASHRFPTYTFIEDKGHPDFFRFYILQPRMKFMLQMISPGGAGRNRVMSKSDFIKLEFLLPDYKEQTAIAQVLQAADKEISLLKAKVEKLREQKKGLMQVLLTGKKRLNQDFQDSGMDRIKNTEAIKSSKS